MGELAGEVDTALPITKAIEQYYAQAEAADRGELDYSAIFTHLEGLKATISASAKETSQGVSGPVMTPQKHRAGRAKHREGLNDVSSVCLWCVVTGTLSKEC